MKRLSDKTHQQILEMRADGHSYSDIVRATGLSQSQVYKVLRKTGNTKKIDRATVTPEIEARILDLNERGATRTEIAAQMNMSLPTVRKVLVRHGHGVRLQRRRKSRLSDEIKAHVVKMHNAGMASRAIGRELGLAHRTVIVILNERVHDLKNTTNSDVSPMEFVAAWQESESVREVCEKTGLSYSQVHQRAYAYRTKGVPLKRFKRGNALNWDDLKEFALLYED